MNDKMLDILAKLINSIRYILTGFWGLLTVIVIFFLVDRYLHPGWKSISNHDLKDYGTISLLFFGIFGVLTFLKNSISNKLKK